MKYRKLLWGKNEGRKKRPREMEKKVRDKVRNREKLCVNTYVNNRFVYDGKYVELYIECIQVNSKFAYLSIL